MKEALQQFLDQHLPLPGLAAWGARLADRSVASQCLTDWFVPEQVERVLSRLTVAVEGLSNHRIQPRRLCWTFQHARIHLALRRDGACLALFMENRTGTPTSGLERIFDDFVALPSV